MVEHAGRWRLGVSMILGAALVAYFFIFPEPLSSELSAKPRWATRVVQTAADPSRAAFGEVEALPFVSQRAYGFVSPDGTLLYAGLGPEGVQALGGKALVARGGRSVVLNADGSEGASVPGEGAFMAAGRLFAADGGGSGVAAYDDYGVEQWRYRFAGRVSAFAAAADIAVAGTLDGKLEGVGLDGSRQFEFAPGGSRIEAIFGVAASQDGARVAAISGLDPQRLVVLGRGGAGYRVVAHKYLDSDFREPARVAFLEGGRYALYRRPDGVGILGLDEKVDGLIPVAADEFRAFYREGAPRAYLYAERGRDKSVVAFKAPTLIYGSLSLPSSAQLIGMQGDALFIEYDDGLYRLDFTEE